MKIYLLSLGAGLLVGAIYALLQVRSPAPPVVALVGLLGILVGEQIPPLLKAVWTRDRMGFGWMSHVHPHVFGALPRGGNPQGTDRTGRVSRGQASVAAGAQVTRDGERG